MHKVRIFKLEVLIFIWYLYFQQEQYSGMKVIFQKTLYLLQLLIRENDNVQFRIFNNLDTLLDVQVVPSDLALALKEVLFNSSVMFFFRNAPSSKSKSFGDTEFILNFLRSNMLKS